MYHYHIMPISKLMLGHEMILPNSSKLMSLRAIKKLDRMNQSNKEGSPMNPNAYQCMDHVVLEKPGKVPK